MKPRTQTMNLVLALLGVMGGMVAGPALSSAQKPKQEPPTDCYGDPLPPGAVARLGTVRFRTGSELAAIAASPDGKLLATGSWHDKTVRLWDAATGRELRRCGEARHSVYSVAFSPDGKLLA